MEDKSQGSSHLKEAPLSVESIYVLRECQVVLLNWLEDETS